MSFSLSSNHHKGTPRAWRHWRPVIQHPSRRRSEEGRERVRATHGAGQKQHVNSTLVLQHVKIREAGDKNRTFDSVVLDTHSSTGHTSTCGEGDRERGGVGLDKVGRVKLGQMQSWQPCHM